jgi:Fur family transcriptional regulator, ferric uptake regulator
MNQTNNTSKFHGCNIKNTKQRNLVLDVLKASVTPLTVEDIFRKTLKGNGSVNLSSVYRILDLFVEKGLVIRSMLPEENRAVYEISSLEHRHYLVCVKCKTIVPLEYCPLKGYEETLEQKTDFDILGHRLNVFGYCPKCRKSKSKDKPYQENR